MDKKEKKLKLIINISNNYKKIILLTTSVILLAGCSQKTAEKTYFKKPAPGTEKAEKVVETSPKTPSIGYESVIKTCDSLCEVDSEAYCLKERIIKVKGESSTGTCRSFSKNKIPGFNRCEGFCKKYGEIE